MAIRVLIADDHPVVRTGLRFVIEKTAADDIEIVAEAGDGLEALALVEKYLPDLVVMDITMPGMNGIEAIRRIGASHPESKAIMLSQHDRSVFVKEALTAGARGYLVKETAMNDIVTAIREVHAGKSYLSPSIAHVVIDDYVSGGGVDADEGGHANLTSREREILQLIAEGLTSKDIAVRLTVSPNTV
ncbi:MAG: response regulator transcription factor, partial [Kiritimatiellia bacterium]|nr:response regulator transcription factor [Kiritimatiellia bacterium]